MEQQLVLVNEIDEVTGTAGKLEAHQKGLLHRAFSIFIFNSKGEMLLQQRSLHKYHSAGLWSNACCSPPSVDEDLAQAARKRLDEEMGFDLAERSEGDGEMVRELLPAAAPLTLGDIRGNGHGGAANLINQAEPL